jgi:hypothetical protein
LREHGISDGLDNAKRGALFVLAKLDYQQCVDLAKKHKLLLNPPEWSRTPGRSRVCFSVEPTKFEIGLERLRDYLSSSSNFSDSSSG